MDSAASACKNCEKPLEENVNYCPNCGQKADTGRINWHFLFHEIQHGIFHVDGGILFTVKELFTRPGHSLREYINGKRKNHFKPVLLIMIIGSICGLINYFLNKKDKLKDDTIADISASSTDLQKMNQYIDLKGFVEYMQKVFKWFPEHLAFTILILVPVAALSFYFAFKKKKVNYVEWLVIMCFMSGQALLVFALNLILEHVSPVLSTIGLIVMVILSYWTMIQYFNDSKKFNVILRTTYGWFLYTIFGSIFIAILATVVTLIGLMMYGNNLMVQELLSK